MQLMCSATGGTSIRGEWRAGARWYEYGSQTASLSQFVDRMTEWRKRQQADNPLVQAELWQRRDRGTAAFCCVVNDCLKR